MSNVFIINAHHKYSFSEGRLNESLVENAETQLIKKGHSVKVLNIADGWEIDDQLENHQWADIVLVQIPVNWMGVPWTFKKYMDEVYTAGADGVLCSGDGRHRDDPKRNYGAGGTCGDKKYMLSLTFNAPEEAFNDEHEYLFQGKDVDDLFFPMHMNFRFFDMQPIPTFACYDVIKNPQIESDFKRFQSHINQHF